MYNKEYHQRYKLQNKSKIKTYQKQWREVNKVDIREKRKKYKKEHPEIIKESKRRYRIKYRLKLNKQKRIYKMRSLGIKADRPIATNCEICNSSKRICFDHNHKTNKFRGWICSDCNSTIGFAREDIEILQKIITYLNLYR